jgi:hypothetical protein
MGQLVGTEKGTPEAMERGLWRVQDFRRVNERWFEFGRTQRVYRPMDCVNLPSHFVSMPLELFFSTYGPLGWLHAAAVSEGEYWLKSIREEQCELEDEIGLSYLTAEPVEWIDAHKAGVAWCLQAGAALALPHGTRKDTQRCEQLCEETRLAMPLEAGFGKVVSRTWRLAGPKFTQRERLGRLLAKHLVSNLKGVRRWPSFHDGRLRTNWGSIALIDTIYSLLADALAGDRMRVCEHCARPFVQTDKRQRFCPPMRDGGKSTCMNTALVRRKRAKAAGLTRETAANQNVLRKPRVK